MPRFCSCQTRSRHRRHSRRSWPRRTRPSVHSCRTHRAHSASIILLHPAQATKSTQMLVSKSLTLKEKMRAGWANFFCFRLKADDQVEIDDSSSSSSGIGMGIGKSYHHLRKNGDLKNAVSFRMLHNSIRLFWFDFRRRKMENMERSTSTISTHSTFQWRKTCRRLWLGTGRWSESWHFLSSYQASLPWSALLSRWFIISPRLAIRTLRGTKEAFFTRFSQRASKIQMVSITYSAHKSQLQSIPAFRQRRWRS